MTLEGVAGALGKAPSMTAEELEILLAPLRAGQQILLRQGRSSFMIVPRDDGRFDVFVLTLDA